jgi:hypothetical protein
MGQRVGPADPRRVEIGRRNRARWKGFTPAGLERLRQAVKEFKPWRFSTGPRTPEGKARCAANGRKCCRDILSHPQIREEIRAANALVRELAELRERVMSRGGPDAGTP